jgi:hypothetical protein
MKGTAMYELSGRAENVDWSDVAMAGRAYADNIVGEPAVTAAMHRMADEIDRLRSLTRFQDGVIRSGDTACLTQAEREAVGRAARIAESCEAMEELTADDADALLGLLERLGGGK